MSPSDDLERVYLEMAPADCKQRGGQRCSSAACSTDVSNRQHMHITPVESSGLPFGVCSENCAMELIAVRGLTIVSKPAEVTP